MVVVRIGTSRAALLFTRGSSGAVNSRSAIVLSVPVALAFGVLHWPPCSCGPVARREAPVAAARRRVRNRPPAHSRAATAQHTARPAGRLAPPRRPCPPPKRVGRHRPCPGGTP